MLTGRAAVTSEHRLYLTADNTFEQLWNEWQIGNRPVVLWCVGVQSIPGFLITGVTTDVLNSAGTMPVRNDVLHKAPRNGESRSLHSLSSHIGSGSSQDCLFGASRISFITPVTVTQSNAENFTILLPSISWYWGGEAHCVIWRTFSTLDEK